MKYFIIFLQFQPICVLGDKVLLKATCNWNFFQSIQYLNVTKLENLSTRIPIVDD